MYFDLTVRHLTAELKTGRGESTGSMELSFEAEESEVLEQIDPQDIVTAVGSDSLLDAIGKQAAMEFWDLEECT